MNTKGIITNMIWRFLERCGAQSVAFIVALVLARILDPSLYGEIALVTVFTTIMQVFVDSGLGNALIQKKDADDLDFSSVFYFNVFACILLYLIMFFSAPLIASFYKIPELIPLVRVISLTLIISGVKNVQHAYVSRNLLFRKFFFATLGGTVGAAIVGIWMACAGFGVWALVVQNLFNATIDTIILWITVKWRPKRMFSFARLKGLFSYGWKLLVSALIDSIYTEIRQLIIGKMYSSADLAQYNRGRQFPFFIVTNINSALDSVLLPALSDKQDDRMRVRMMTRRAIMTSTYIMAPMMMGLAVIGKPLVEVILTEKWLPCVFFLRIFCVTFMFYPIHTANLNAIKALGRSDLFLKLEIIKKIVGISLLLATMWISVEALAYSMLLSSVANQIINSWPNKKLLGYSYLEQLKDILPGIGLAVIMASIVYSIQYIDMPVYLVLITQLLTGVIIYVALSKLFKLESYNYVVGILKQYRRIDRL